MSFRILPVAITLCALPQLAWAQEQKIARAHLPPAVERAVAQQSQGATIRGLSKEIDHGHATYEMELTVAGHSKDVTMDSTGAVIELEEEVQLDSLPRAVREGITAQTGSNRVSTVERLSKGGTVVAYEAHLTVNGKRTEVQVGPNGEKLDHEE